MATSFLVLIEAKSRINLAHPADADLRNDLASSDVFASKNFKGLANIQLRACFCSSFSTTVSFSHEKAELTPPSRVVRDPFKSPPNYTLLA